MSALAIHDEGEGPCVLVLGGSPTPAALVMPMVRRLATRHRVLVPDLPGYGLSAPLLRPYALERAQDLLETAVLGRGIENLAIVGLSLGAYRALAIALAGRVRVRSIACLGGFAGWDPPVRDGLLGLAGAIGGGVTHLGDAPIAAILVGQMLAPAFATAHPAVAAEVGSWLGLMTPADLASEIEAVAHCRDLRPELATLAIPIMVRVGALDQATPPDVASVISRGVQRGELQIVDGKGHLLLLEDEAATIAAVEQFLT